ncbi:MAG: hypothetical protein PWP27_1586 [Clostridiales bacterium]|jgi:uncharacterized protein YxeA|nr:hypothetical protein [Clostridiales bacterium]MDK2933776.1 hypothetical protein [Clostridiales bacterium]
MFIVTFKLNRKKILIAILIILMVLILGASAFIKSKDLNIFNTLKQEVIYNFTNIKTNEDRIEFLKQFGWEVEEKPLEIMEVHIPEELDLVYENYNEIQKEIGLDLERHKGKRVKKYTYRVLNYPSCIDEEVRANILIYKDEVIAGDIMTTAIDGFMHSLIYKE